MIIFLIVRIVGLWILLILSPMAFFSTALPGKLQGAFSVFTKDFWGKLSSFLISGPVMAFFLWLTLAVVQGSPTSFSSMFKETPEVNSAAEAAHFATAVGSTSNIATFIVVIALLMSGVEFAVKSAAAASTAAGKYATK
jgi:hypothetical protein